jgi:hypothetical protein
MNSRAIAVSKEREEKRREEKTGGIYIYIYIYTGAGGWLLILIGGDKIHTCSGGSMIGGIFMVSSCVPYKR